MPQQMEKKRFVRVTLGGLNYYYTPANSTDANLAAGKLYAYTITVNKGGIIVSASGATDWTGTTSEVTSDEIFTASNLKIGDYYYSDGTWSDGGLRKLYTDRRFEKEDVAPDLTGGRTVIGIVFKVGRDVSGDWKDDCVYKTKSGSEMSTINGYVLALYDANGGKTCEWGSFGTKVGTDTEQNTGFYGYKNTNTIKSYAENNGKTLEFSFPATYHATESYETSYPAPDNSSGWFLLSAGQGQYWLNNKNVLLASVQKATSTPGYSWKNIYGSSSEDESSPEQDAWSVRFGTGEMNWSSKGYGGQNVRSLFAF